jgi:hypothetical protein
MTAYTGYWLVYVNAASEDGPPQLTVIPARCTEREQLIRDARSVLATADAYHALHPDQRVVFFGEITRWLVKEKQTTWGQLEVDFEVALAHLDHHAPNVVLDTDLVTATIIATPADRVLITVPGGANSITIDTAPIKQMILDLVDAELAVR